MKKISLVEDIFIHTAIIITLLMLQIIFIDINKYFFAICYVYVYLSLYKNTKLYLLAMFVLLTLVLDSIHYITIGVSILTITIYYLVILIQNHYLKNLEFVFAYTIFIAVNILTLLLQNLLQIFVEFSSNMDLSFIIINIILYPIFYLIVTLFYNKHA